MGSFSGESSLYLRCEVSKDVFGVALSRYWSESDQVALSFWSHSIDTWDWLTGEVELSCVVGFV